MRFFYLLILIFAGSVIATKSVAQNDSTNKLSNGNETLPDTGWDNGLKTVETLKPSKEILPDTIQPKKDSATVTVSEKDSIIKPKHDPRKATRRSAIIPGWGQAYNREYWKIPIVYGALAVPASLFVYNNTWYQRTKEGYDILVNGGDTSKIYPDLVGLDAPTLQYYRNSFRRNRDYSVLFFLLVWGLNVVDATVFAHLKNFDVSDDLSLRVQPDYNFFTKSPSLSLALSFKAKQPKMLPSAF